MVKSLKLGVVLGAIALATLIGCSRPAPTMPVPPTQPAQVAAASCQKAELGLECAIQKTFAASEFTRWVENAEVYVARATDLTEYTNVLEREIEKISGKKPIPEFVERIEAPERQPETGDVRGFYRFVPNQLLVEKKDLMTRVMHMASVDQINEISMSEAYLHELLHMLQDLGSEVDVIESFQNEMGFKYCLSTADTSGSKALVLITKTAHCDFLNPVLEFKGYAHGNIVWADSMQLAEADRIIQAYAARFMPNAGKDVNAAGQELSDKLRGLIVTGTARLVIQEAQGYFAFPPVEKLKPEGTDLEEKLLRIVRERRPRDEDQHSGYIRAAIQDTARGYAALQKAGVRGIQAHIAVAGIVRNSMTVSQDKFQPYEKLNKNVADMVRALNVQEPTHDEVTNILIQRKGQIEGHWDRMRKAMKDYINATIIKDVIDRQVIPSLQAQKKGITSATYKFLTMKLKENPAGTYTLSTTLEVTAK